MNVIICESCCWEFVPDWYCVGVKMNRNRLFFFFFFFLLEYMILYENIRVRHCHFTIWNFVTVCKFCFHATFFWGHFKVSSISETLLMLWHLWLTYLRHYSCCGTCGRHTEQLAFGHWKSSLKLLSLILKNSTPVYCGIRLDIHDLL